MRLPDRSLGLSISNGCPKLNFADISPGGMAEPLGLAFPLILISPSILNLTLTPSAWASGSKLKTAAES